MNTNINSREHWVATKKNEEDLHILIWENVQALSLGKKRQ